MLPDMMIVATGLAMGLPGCAERAGRCALTWDGDGIQSRGDGTRLEWAGVQQLPVGSCGEKPVRLLDALERPVRRSTRCAGPRGLRFPGVRVGRQRRGAFRGHEGGKGEGEERRGEEEREEEKRRMKGKRRKRRNEIGSQRLERELRETRKDEKARTHEHGPKMGVGVRGDEGRGGSSRGTREPEMELAMGTMPEPRSATDGVF